MGWGGEGKGGEGWCGEGMGEGVVRRWVGEESVGLDVLGSGRERDMLRADSRDICINGEVIVCED